MKTYEVNLRKLEDGNVRIDISEDAPFGGISFEKGSFTLTPKPGMNLSETDIFKIKFIGDKNAVKEYWDVDLL